MKLAYFSAILAAGADSDDYLVARGVQSDESHSLHSSKSPFILTADIIFRNYPI